MKAPLIVIDSAIDPEKLKEFLMVLEQFAPDPLDRFRVRKNAKSPDYQKGYDTGYQQGRRSVEGRKGE